MIDKEQQRNFHNGILPPIHIIECFLYISDICILLVDVM